LIGAALAVFLATVHRPSGHLWPHLFNAAHVLISVVVAVVALRLSRRFLAKTFPGRSAHYWVAAAVVFCLGGGLELAQFVIPGEPSLKDLVGDLLGGSAGLLFALSLDDHSAPGRGSPTARRWLLRGVSVGLLCWGLLPSAKGAAAVARQSRAFPRIAGFEATWEKYFVSAGDGAELAVEPPPAEFTRARGHAVGRVVFTQAKYPKLELSDLTGDWSSYASLVFEVYSPEKSPVKLTVSIHDDGPVREYADHFNTVLAVSPGQNTISLPVDFVRTGASNRPMHLGRIESIVMFLTNPPRPVTLYFDEFRLEGTR
jgi:hypothetical protein